MASRFRVAPGSKHKTGFFLDQRDNRRTWPASVPGKRVLDLCCNTGGFAVYAKALGGAEEVIGIDLDEQAPGPGPAERQSEPGARPLRAGRPVPLAARRRSPPGQRFDVVVLDPAKQTRDREAIDLRPEALSRHESAGPAGGGARRHLSDLLLHRPGERSRLPGVRAPAAWQAGRNYKCCGSPVPGPTIRSCCTSPKDAISRRSSAGWTPTGPPRTNRPRRLRPFSSPRELSGRHIRSVFTDSDELPRSAGSIQTSEFADTMGRHLASTSRHITPPSSAALLSSGDIHEPSVVRFRRHADRLRGPGRGPGSPPGELVAAALARGLRSGSGQRFSRPSRVGRAAKICETFGPEARGRHGRSRPCRADSGAAVRGRRTAGHRAGRPWRRVSPRRGAGCGSRIRRPGCPLPPRLARASICSGTSRTWSYVRSSAPSPMRTPRSGCCRPIPLHRLSAGIPSTTAPSTASVWSWASGSTRPATGASPASSSSSPASRGASLTSNSSGSPAGGPVFFDPVIDKQVIVLFSNPDVSNGSVDTLAQNRLWGSELDLRRRLTTFFSDRLDFIVGYRHIGFDESLDMGGTTSFISPAPNPASQISFADHFGVHNNFDGAVVGLESEYDVGCLFLDLRGKFGLGNVHDGLGQRHHELCRTLPGTPNQQFNGGILRSRRTAAVSRATGSTSWAR